MVNTNLNWDISLYSFMEIVNGNMGPGFKIPKLDLALFFPTNKRKWSLQSSFFESYFFRGGGKGRAVDKETKLIVLKKMLLNMETYGNFCHGFANDKNKFKLLDQKRIQESHGIQGQEWSKGLNWKDGKWSNQLILGDGSTLEPISYIWEVGHGVQMLPCGLLPLCRKSDI